MADVKESAMTQQSDCKWVRALDANGNSIRISKEDLASVVGGLLDENSTLKQRGVIRLTEEIDLAKYIQNNIAHMKNGIYTVSGFGGATAIGDWGTLEKLSETSLLFFPLNMKTPVFFFKDAIRWSYAILSGSVVEGPF